jgi:homoserine acetyltransferase
MRVLRDALVGNARLVEISSAYGHDAFLKETEVLGGLIAQALADT